MCQNLAWYLNCCQYLRSWTLQTRWMLLQVFLTYIVEELEILLSALNTIISNKDTRIRWSDRAQLCWRKVVSANCWKVVPVLMEKVLPKIDSSCTSCGSVWLYAKCNVQCLETVSLWWYFCFLGRQNNRHHHHVAKEKQKMLVKHVVLWEILFRWH